MKKKKKNSNANPWFRRLSGNSTDEWGFIPINWKGWASVITLFGINVFSANYFRLNELGLDNYLRIGVVFLLSVFVFIEISIKKTRK